jgi:ABC-2 type transport system ATP-binding protein
MSQPLLKITQLSHRFGNRQVLRNVEIDVQPGEVVGLMGPNGSGKSTTLQILTGLVQRQSGEISLRGHPISAGDRALRARTGVVFQSASLDPKLTARENLRLSAALYSLHGRTARERIDELLQLVTLADRADEPVRTLSGGMRRRVDLARALLHSPDMLLLDEPTSGLDQGSFVQFWNHLHAMRARHQLSVLVATHRADEAEHCDRLYILHHGEIVAQGTPAELRRRVSGDVITMEVREPGDVARIRSILHATFHVTPSEREHVLTFQHANAYQLIPSLVEACGPSALASIAMRQPSLTDVFVSLTGEPWQREPLSTLEPAEKRPAHPKGHR